MSEINPGEITADTSWRTLIAPERWAQACHDTAPEYFDARVRNMDSERHLRAALDVETDRDDPRRERIGTINQQLAALSDDES